MTSRNPKVYLHNTVLEICSSVQDGLPLTCAPYIKTLLEGILAAASSMYPVKLCHYLFMANHFHMILVVQNPEDVKEFVKYLKSESAHAINRLLGRNQRSLWCARFDSPVILTPDKVLERLQYMYLNPVEANLVRFVEDYPGLSTFKLFKERRTLTKVCKKVSRTEFTPLPERALSSSEQEDYSRMLLGAKGRKFTLKVDPWAWLQCFSSTESWDKEVILKRFLLRLSDKEKELSLKREFPPLGAARLRNQDPRTPYKSTRKGLKMICLSSCVETRNAFISAFKTYKQKAKEVFQLWRKGDYSRKPPPGFFAPGGLLFANALVFTFF